VNRLPLISTLIFGFLLLSRLPLPATFSIVAYDPETGRFGAAVTSRAIAVGDRVPWVRSGVGAVCTQASTNRSWGPRALDLLEKGKTPEEVVAELVKEDERPDNRQLGLIDSQGRSAGWCGKWNPDYAGLKRGENFQVQGNILAGEQVLAAMADAFTGTKGELAARLLAALEAGMAAGGDSRGRQSAALLVSGTEPDRYGYTHNLYDIRVDDHPYPVRELRRLYRYKLAMDRVWSIKTENLDEVISELKKIAAEYPEQALVHYQLACRLSLAGMIDEAVVALANCLRIHPTYRLGAGNSRKLEARMQEVWDRLKSARAPGLDLERPE